MRHTVKCITQETADPTMPAGVRPRKVGRHAMGHPTTEWYYFLQGLPDVAVVESDSSWAGAGDAKRTQYAAMISGAHCLDVATSTRNYAKSASGIAELLSLNRAGSSAPLLKQILHPEVL